MIAGLFNCPSVYVKKVEAKGKTYTISPNKIPKSVKKSSAYNKNNAILSKKTAKRRWQTGSEKGDI